MKKKRSVSEKIFLEELAQTAHKAKTLLKGLSAGEFLKLVRKQLGMSQRILAQRAKVPQSTVIRLEQGTTDPSYSTLAKLFQAMQCDLLIVPMLLQPIDVIRRKQARKKAEKKIRYLKGTMNLEEQQPDSRLVEELIQEEETRLLHGNGKELWEES